MNDIDTLRDILGAPSAHYTDDQISLIFSQLCLMADLLLDIHFDSEDAADSTDEVFDTLRSGALASKHSPAKGRSKKQIVT
jgi:hypothetical protein